MLRLVKTVRDIKLSKSKKESGFKSNYAYKDAKRVWWANETSYYDYYPY